MRKWQSLKQGIGVILLGGILLSGIAYSQETKQATIVLGSSTLANMVDHWSQTFGKTSPDTRIVVSPTRTGPGIEALIAGKADICMASRPMKSQEISNAEEKGVKIGTRRVGTDALIVVVNASNPLTAITMEQLADIFSGKTSNWSDLGGPRMEVTPVIQPYPQSGTSEFFKESVLGSLPYGTACTVAEGLRVAEQKVSKSEGGVSYASWNDQKAIRRNPSLKILPVQKDTRLPAISATGETMRDGSYPLTRPLFLYFDAASPNGTVKSFVEYCGQMAEGKP